MWYWVRFDLDTCDYGVVVAAGAPLPAGADPSDPPPVFDVIISDHVSGSTHSMDAEFGKLFLAHVCRPGSLQRSDGHRTSGAYDENAFSAASLVDKTSQSSFPLLLKASKAAMTSTFSSRAHWLA
jgi:hypothetical protein